VVDHHGDDWYCTKRPDLRGVAGGGHCYCRGDEPMLMMMTMKIDDEGAHRTPPPPHRNYHHPIEHLGDELHVVGKVVLFVHHHRKKLMTPYYAYAAQSTPPRHRHNHPRHRLRHLPYPQIDYHRRRHHRRRSQLYRDVFGSYYCLDCYYRRLADYYYRCCHHHARRRRRIAEEQTMPTMAGRTSGPIRRWWLHRQVLLIIRERPSW
jgi:hypothetical protein